MKINLVTSGAKPTQRQITTLESLGEFTIIDAQKWTSDKVIKNIPDTEILIAGPSGIAVIDKKLLQGLKKLQYISTLTVGLDWIDLKSARELRIPISNIKGANSESVAEHAWGMILNLAKRITEFNKDAIFKGAFKFTNYRGIEVYGKTIGIIGLGDIGKKVARIAKGFDMKILGVNKSKKLVEGVELVDLNDLFIRSDVIVVCTPLTEETNNMIDEKEISKMKNGVILVNPARPEITNKKAVLRAVNSGKIFGFGIETDIMMQIPSGDPYLTQPRVLATPHNAFNTVDAEIKSFDTVISNIKSYLDGKIKNLVT